MCDLPAHLICSLELNGIVLSLLLHWGADVDAVTDGGDLDKDGRE
jgi:hypothetical protein